MSEINDIVQTIETVRDSVAVIKAAADDREEWALRFEQAASNMLSVAEELEKSISNVETVVSGKLAGPIRKVMEGFEKITTDARTALEGAEAQLSEQLEAARNLVTLVSRLSDQLPNVSTEIRAAVTRMVDAETEVTARLSSTLQEHQSSVVAELNKLALSIHAVHDTLPQAVAEILGDEFSGLRADIARFAKEGIAVARNSQKATLDVAGEVIALSGEVRELKEMIEELSTRKRGLFKN